MPSARHQAWIRLLTEGRGVLRAVLAWVGIDVPAELELRPGPEVVRDGGRYDLCADGTMVAHGRAAGGQAGAYVIEVQLGEDDRKLYTWPLYVVVIRRRLKCRTTLLVFTDSESVARWAAQAIELGDGGVLRPIVIGPAQIPRDVTEELALKVPAAAVLAVVAHGRGPDAERLARLALLGVRSLLTRDEELAMLHMDVLAAYLDPALLEALMEEQMQVGTYEPISDLFRRHRAEGRAEGLVDAVLTVLETRGFEISSSTRARVLACTDSAQLHAWLRRATTAASPSEVFADD